MTDVSADLERRGDHGRSRSHVQVINLDFVDDVAIVKDIAPSLRDIFPVDLEKIVQKEQKAVSDREQFLIGEAAGASEHGQKIFEYLSRTYISNLS